MGSCLAARTCMRMMTPAMQMKAAVLDVAAALGKDAKRREESR